MNSNIGIKKDSLWTKNRPTTALVKKVVPDQVDTDGNRIQSGTVEFINDAGSKCVMTITQFHEMYGPNTTGFLYEDVDAMKHAADYWEAQCKELTAKLETEKTNVEYWVKSFNDLRAQFDDMQSKAEKTETEKDALLDALKQITSLEGDEIWNKVHGMVDLSTYMSPLALEQLRKELGNEHS